MVNQYKIINIIIIITTITDRQWLARATARAMNIVVIIIITNLIVIIIIIIIIII